MYYQYTESIWKVSSSVDRAWIMSLSLPNHLSNLFHCECKTPCLQSWFVSHFNPMVTDKCTDPKENGLSLFTVLRWVSDIWACGIPHWDLNEQESFPCKPLQKGHQMAPESPGPNSLEGGTKVMHLTKGCKVYVELHKSFKHSEMTSLRGGWGGVHSAPLVIF